MKNVRHLREINEKQMSDNWLHRGLEAIYWPQVRVFSEFTSAHVSAFRTTEQSATREEGRTGDITLR